MAGVPRLRRPRPPTKPKPRPTLVVLITTFDRPALLMRLLEDIDTQAAVGGHRVHVRVYDDASSRDYSGVVRYLQTRKHFYRRATTRHGKQRLWEWMNCVLQDAKNSGEELFLFLQDDIRLCKNFFTQLQARWSELRGRPATLNLHRDEERARATTGCWTLAPLQRMGKVSSVGWTDCAAFLCARPALAALGWRLKPIPKSRWSSNARLSSGVGQQLSTRLHRGGWALYRTELSLVVHADAPSQLNPRRRESMRTVHFVDGSAEVVRLERQALPREKVTASLATIPGRRESLRKVVRSLLPQVDQLNVYLNRTPVRGRDEYPRLPGFLLHPKICAVWCKDTSFGDQGDAGKYYWASEIEGYHVICDDDVLYPPDFIAALVGGVEKYQRQVVVGFHGAILTTPFQRYYGSRRTYHFSSKQGKDVPVHIVAGAGGVCYHSSTLQVHRDDFKHPNMGDIWFALLAQQQKVPCVCLAHARAWLQDGGPPGEDSIYSRSTGDEGANWKNTADVQTRVIKDNMPWKVRAADGRVLAVVRSTP